MPFDSIQLSEVSDFWADDYGDFYFLNKNNLNFTKYDSLGKKKGEMLWAVPFHVQPIDNPLNVVLFSENAQQLRFVDQNLNEIQDAISLSPEFGFVKAAYVEDQQYVWILDQSLRNLSKFDYRQKNIIKSYPFDMDYEDVKQLMVYKNQIYIIRKSSFEVWDFSLMKIFSQSMENITRIYQRKNKINLQTNTENWVFDGKDKLAKNFSASGAEHISSNFQKWFAIINNQLYLYQK